LLSKAFNSPSAATSWQTVNIAQSLATLAYVNEYYLIGNYCAVRTCKTLVKIDIDPLL